MPTTVTQHRTFIGLFYTRAQRYYTKPQKILSNPRNYHQPVIQEFCHNLYMSICIKILKIQHSQKQTNNPQLKKSHLVLKFILTILSIDILLLNLNPGNVPTRHTCNLKLNRSQEKSHYPIERYGKGLIDLKALQKTPPQHGHC